MNQYSDIPFYIQELIINEDDEGSVLLMSLRAPDRPKEYIDINGILINKANFKPIDWQRIVQSDLPRPKRTYLPWEVGTITSHNPLKYEVTREKAPLYEIADNLSKYHLPTVKDEHKGQFPFKVEQLSIEPMPAPKHNPWALAYDGPDGTGWVNALCIQPIDYIKTEIFLDAKPEIPVKTIDITFNTEKEDDT